MIFSAEKTIRTVRDPEEQQAETYRYWQSLSVGARLSAVWDVSEVAYAFAAALKGVPLRDAQKRKRAIVRINKQDDRVKG